VTFAHSLFAQGVLAPEKCAAFAANQGGTAVFRPWLFFSQGVFILYAAKKFKRS
jgi:hypothetical protein